MELLPNRPHCSWVLQDHLQCDQLYPAQFILSLSTKTASVEWLRLYSHMQQGKDSTLPLVTNQFWRKKHVYSGGPEGNGWGVMPWALGLWGVGNDTSLPPPTPNLMQVAMLACPFSEKGASWHCDLTQKCSAASSLLGATSQSCAPSPGCSPLLRATWGRHAMPPSHVVHDLENQCGYTT